MREYFQSSKIIKNFINELSINISAPLMQHIMHNRLYTYLTKNKIFFKKQFGFRAVHSTDYALVVPVDQMCESFDEGSIFEASLLTSQKLLIQ